MPVLSLLLGKEANYSGPLVLCVSISAVVPLQRYLSRFESYQIGGGQQIIEGRGSRSPPNRVGLLNREDAEPEGDDAIGSDIDERPNSALSNLSILSSGSASSHSSASYRLDREFESRYVDLNMGRKSILWNDKEDMDHSPAVKMAFTRYMAGLRLTRPDGRIIDILCFVNPPREEEDERHQIPWSEPVSQNSAFL